MTTRKPEISRRQAWCKLAVLIADGLPDPAGIKFHVDRSSIYLDFATAEALAVWAERLGMPLDAPIRCDDGDWIHGASNVSNKSGWHGFYVRLVAYTKGEPDPAPVDEDMASVRAIAADACVCCSPDDCGDRLGHVRNDRDGGDLCNCGRDWPCEKAGA